VSTLRSWSMWSPGGVPRFASAYGRTNSSMLGDRSCAIPREDLARRLESLVVWNGEEVVTTEEVQAWLRRELSGIPAQHDLQPKTQ
jgi:hypothetical protein